MLEARNTNGESSNSLFVRGVEEEAENAQKHRVEVIKAPSMVTLKVTTSNSFGG